MTTTAYWFCKSDMTAGSGNEPPWAVGEERTIEGEVIPCKRGYHSSPTPWDALQYAPGPVLCLVEISGTVIQHNNDKQVSNTRKLIRAVNIERELRLFAADCAEEVLHLFEQQYPDDDRPRKAIAATRAYANGEIDTAARDAALDAARTAARAAARTAARAAARDAARDAARAAARDAARDAARAAAWPASDAASAVARAGQRGRFNALCYGLLRVEVPG